ncbi:MAG: antitoxin [Rickettsiaceae bacterium]
MEKAKIFINGQSQDVRLPKKYRFNTKEVYINQLGKSVVLSPVHKGWKQLFDNITIIQNNDFLTNREDTTPQDREYF